MYVGKVVIPLPEVERGALSPAAVDLSRFLELPEASVLAFYAGVNDSCALKQRCSCEHICKRFRCRDAQRLQVYERELRAADSRKRDPAEWVKWACTFHPSVHSAQQVHIRRCPIPIAPC